jgi:isochorismate synthase EntC
MKNSLGSTSTILPSWFDDSFFSLGCFCSLENGSEVLFAKGGQWSQIDKKSSLQFEFRDFYQTQRWFYYPEDFIVFDRKDFQSIPDPIESIKRASFTNSDELFLEDFDRLQKSWSHELQKVVLMSRKTWQIDNPLGQKKATMLRVLKANFAYAYGFWKNDYSILGLTPEILFHLKGNNLSTMALAGTALKENANSLLESSKDHWEHEIVVRNITADLSVFCEEVVTGKRELYSFGSLVHLKTPLSARIKDLASPGDIIDLLSPTAALGGHPRHEAVNFLRSTSYYKNFPDRYHGSVFSYHFEKEYCALVMIRNIQIKDKTLILEAGAGIIPQSLKESELNEIHHKQQAIEGLLL